MHVCVFTYAWNLYGQINVRDNCVMYTEVFTYACMCVHIRMELVRPETYVLRSVGVIALARIESTIQVYCAGEGPYVHIDI